MNKVMTYIFISHQYLKRKKIHPMKQTKSHLTNIWDFLRDALLPIISSHILNIKALWRFFFCVEINVNSSLIYVLEQNFGLITEFFLLSYQHEHDIYCGDAPLNYQL